MNNKPRVVNIQAYGDFDMPVTCASLRAPEGLGKKVINSLLCEAADQFESSDDLQAAIKYLQERGFETVKSYNLTIGGNT